MFNILSKINTLPAIVSALVSITLKDLLYRLVHKKLRKMNKYINRKHFREAKASESYGKTSDILCTRAGGT